MATTRERLLDAAAGLVDEGGPSAVTLREVGRLSGVSHNAPYKHFTDKRDLLASVAARELDGLTERMQAAVTASPTPAERLVAVALAYVEWAQRHPERFKLAFGQWQGEHDELGRAADAAVTLMDRTIATAHAEGSFRGSPERTAAMLWALGHGAVDLWLSGHLAKHGTAPTPGELVVALVAELTRP